MKIVAIGVGKNTFTGQEMDGCCLIYSKATFDQLKEDFGLYRKSYTANGYGGNCGIKFQLENDRLELTGRKFKQEGHNYGSDSDWGNEYPYNWKFTEVWEVKENAAAIENEKKARIKKLQKDWKAATEAVKRIEKEMEALRNEVKE